MLNYIADTEGLDNMRRSAERIKKAYNIALAKGETTRDLGGGLKTDGFAKVMEQNILKMRP